MESLLHAIKFKFVSLRLLLDGELNLFPLLFLRAHLIFLLLLQLLPDSLAVALELVPLDFSLFEASFKLLYAMSFFFIFFLEILKFNSHAFVDMV